MAGFAVSSCHELRDHAYNIECALFSINFPRGNFWELNLLQSSVTTEGVVSCSLFSNHFLNLFSLCQSTVFPLSGCGQFGRMLVAMSTGDQRSKIALMNIQMSKCDPYREKFLLTERDN